MKIIYFDICSIPLFLVVLVICYARKMTRGNANRLFLAVMFLSLFSTVADLGMEIADNNIPLTEAGRIICCASTYVYLALRNATNAVLLLFLLSLTRTTHLVRKKWVRVVFCLPYACVLLLLAQNPFTHSAFTVTAEAGYARGPLMMAFYGIAMFYGIFGFAYCIYCRRYLPTNKWAALLIVYLLVHLAVAIQFFRPDLLVEMFCTAVAELVIMLMIMRPEERMDSEVGMLSWASYQSDLRNILLSNEHVQIVVIRILNSQEIRNYLGDHDYNKYLSEIANAIRSLPWQHQQRIELYFERPGTIYMVADEDEAGTENIGERLLAEAGEEIKRYAEMGVRFELRVCLLRCPEELSRFEDVISLGHRFFQIGQHDQLTTHAADIVHSRGFEIEAHMDEILSRALREKTLVMYYQPIYDVKSGRFRSAEALARLDDPVYGMISPGVFIPAAESMDYIVPIGELVLEDVFRFVSEHDLDALGLDYIEINLSVAQCMQSALPETMRRLQEKYGVSPSRINLEITETIFETVSDVMLQNVDELIRMGYSFALDDYGIGYSSIQRVNRLPLELIKIDKSMLDEITSSSGRMILQHTVWMMQSINKKLVAEGAETRDEVLALRDMSCDFIQGFFFSRPLPEDEFVRFITDHAGEVISVFSAPQNA